VLVLDPLAVLLTLAATRDHGRAMSLENGTALPTVDRHGNRQEAKRSLFHLPAVTGWSGKRND
jgi:hypothetical protein